MSISTHQLVPKVYTDRHTFEGYGEVDMCGTIVAAHTCPLYRTQILGPAYYDGLKYSIFRIPRRHGHVHHDVDCELIVKLSLCCRLDIGLNILASLVVHPWHDHGGIQACVTARHIHT